MRPCQILAAASSTLLWLRVARVSLAGLLFCERRGWRRQLTNQLTRFCAAIIPVFTPCVGSCSVSGEYESVLDFFKGHVSGHLGGLVGTEVMHARVCLGEGVKMANGGRCSGLMQTGRLLAWMQSLFVVSHEARKQAFCLFSLRC